VCQFKCHINCQAKKSKIKSDLTETGFEPVRASRFLAPRVKSSAHPHVYHFRHSVVAGLSRLSDSLAHYHVNGLTNPNSHHFRNCPRLVFFGIARIELAVLPLSHP